MDPKEKRSGDALYREAEKCVKPNVWKLKFTPDWNGASELYERAATILRKEKHHDRSRQAYEKAALAQERIGSKWHAAKLMEMASMEAKDAGEGAEEVVSCVRAAALLYREAGRELACSDALSRGAKLVESLDAKKAYGLLKESIEIYEEEEKHAQVIDVYREALNLLVRHELYGEATLLLMRWGKACEACEAKHTQRKVYMNAVIIYLYMEDVVQANCTFMECLHIDGFEDSDEAFAVSELLDSYKTGDPELIASCIRSNRTFLHTDNCIARLAKQLPTGDATILAQHLESMSPEDSAGPNEVLDENDLS